MRRALGYAVITDPQVAAAQAEWDTTNCGHCQRVIFTKPGSAQTVYLFPQVSGEIKEEMGAFCRVCMRPVCLACHDLGVCLPWEKQLALQEALAKRGRGT